MYVAPRPDVNDDPLFAVRLASMAVAVVALIPYIQPDFPGVLVALPIVLVAGMRKAFDPKKAFGAPIAVIVLIWLMTLIVSAARPMPGLVVAIMGVFYFLGFYLIQKTGHPMGMFVVIVTMLSTVIGLNSTDAMTMIRDGMTEAAVATALLVPILYLVFPPAAKDNLIEIYPPSPGPHAASALIRTFVLLVLSYWLFAVVQVTNLMLAMVAVFVLVFPTRETLFAEARERSMATVFAAFTAGSIVFVMTLNAHFSVLLGLVFLAGLFFGSRMMQGRHPSTVYQFALSTTLSLLAAALLSREPGYAVLTRTSLTLAGAICASLATAILETLLLPDPPRTNKPPKPAA